MLTRNRHMTIPSGAVQVHDLALDYPVYRSVVRDRFRALLGAVMPSLMPPVRRLLDRISFSIEPGEVVGIGGRNGAVMASLHNVISAHVVPTHCTYEVGRRHMALLSC